MKKFLFVFLILALAIAPVMGAVTTTYSNYVSTYKYNVTKFTGTGTTTWTVPSGVTDIRFMIVAGGGGGGYSGGGGGGGGGVVYDTSYAVTPGHVWTINVGAGGTGSSSSNTTGGNGGPSILYRSGTANFTALGGGGGGSYSGAAAHDGAAGGSGGGASSVRSAVTKNGGSAVNGTTDFGASSAGYAGGQTNSSVGNNYPYPSAGGGGAGGIGKCAGYDVTTCTTVNNTGPGGNGRGDVIETGSTLYYGGGGGGGIASNNGFRGIGGAGGGGNGSLSSTASGTAGTDGLGGGGGGGGPAPYADGENGGSGVIIIRYEEPLYKVDTSLQNTSMTNNMEPTPVTFTSFISNVSIYNYTWQVSKTDGNNTIMPLSTSANFTTIFTAGTYQVNLTVYDNVNGIFYNCTPYNTTINRQINVRPWADMFFTAYSDSDDDNLVHFDLSHYPYKITAVNVTSRSFDFDDGHSSTNATNSFTNYYASHGTYDVSLSGVFRNGYPFTCTTSITVPLATSPVLLYGAVGRGTNVPYLVNDTFITLGPSSSNITSLDIPEMGGWYAAGTSEPKVYHQNIPTEQGFGIQYSGTANAGESIDIKATDSLAYSIEARGLYADIYQLDTVRKGTYTTGGPVSTVDTSVKNGLWMIAGGGDGKVYIFSKDTTSNWYVFFQGDSNSTILSSAMSWRGEAAAVGRNDGTLEYYITTGDSSATTTFDVSVFVSKGGSAYSGQNISVYDGPTAAAAQVSTTIYASGDTDTSGKFVFTAESGRYYSIRVNTNEYIYMYQGTSTYPTITINIPAALITSPYQYASTFNDSTKQITTTYQDANVATVKINITDMVNGTVLFSTSYTSSNIVDTHTVPYGDHEYRINIYFTRTTGHTYTDTLYVHASNYYKVTHTPAQWILFEYAAYTIMLMLIALAIGATGTKYGVVMLPALALLGVWLGFLPNNLVYMGCLGVACFIAFLRTLRRE